MAKRNVTYDIKTYNLKTPITLGQKMMLYLQGQQTQVAIKKIERIFNEGSKVSKNNTKFIILFDPE